jgi:hypothetical protein
MSRPIKVPTTAATVPVPALIAASADFMGLSATNGTGQPYYVKLLWTGQSNITQAQISSAMTQLGCTIIPVLTIEVPTTGLYVGPQHYPISYAGPLYLWAVSSAIDATNTSLTAAVDEITVFID